VEDRADAEVGIICLLVGFVLQGIGHTSGLFGTEAATGSSEAWTALGMAGLGSAAALGLWRLLRKRRALRLLPRVALAQGNDDPPGQWTQTRAGLLLSCGVRLGHEQQDGEGKVAYARRVFKLELPQACD
jgi:hypothetical protein